MHYRGNGILRVFFLMVATFGLKYYEKIVKFLCVKGDFHSMYIMHIGHLPFLNLF